jgi:hypothetical protein
MFGAYLDDWAHHQFELETFFTPWHAVLYSGFLLLSSILVITFVRNLMRGYPWKEAMPAGYGLSLLGVLVFFAAGFGDMAWHTLFGIEVSLEAFLSPPHLLLALGGALIGTGPLRAAWLRKESGVPELPVILSLAGLLATLAFFTSFAHPLLELVHVGDSNFYARSLTVAGILLQSALLMGIVLLALLRWKLPFGSLTLVFTLTTAYAVIVHENFEMLPFALVAGLAADLLATWLGPSRHRRTAFRLFAFLVPVIFYGLYFATRAISGELHWTVPLWAGSLVMAGAAGLLLSFAFLPPRLPEP